MKRMSFILLAAALCGCCTCPEKKGGEAKPAPATKKVVRHKPVKKPVLPPPAPRLEGKDVVQHDAPAVRLTASAGQLARSLRAMVAVTGAAADSAADRKLAETVAPSVRSALGNAGFEVVFDGSADIYVNGTANCLAGSARGSRVACRGSLELNFLRVDGLNPTTGKITRRVVDSRRFDAKSGEARSEEEALVALGDALSAASGKWLREAGARITDDLAICDVTIRYSDGRTPIEGDYPATFVKAVLKTKGIHDCRIMPMDKSGATMNARILYEPKQVPEGVLNRLMSIKSLKLGR